MKHTPGPWYLNYTDGGVLYEDGNRDKAIAPDIYGRTKEECEANARLVAAAPQLLEVCRAVINDWHSHDANFHKKEPEYLKMARQAVAAVQNDC